MLCFGAGPAGKFSVRLHPRGRDIQASKKQHWVTFNRNEWASDFKEISFVMPNIN